MQIGENQAIKIIITGKENEVLAVVTDKEIIEKDGISVVIDWESA